MLDNDIIVDFQKETNQILEELEQIVETLEETEEDAKFPAELLAGFAQRIDRIMGAAQTMAMLDAEHIGLQKIGTIAKICKGLGYKASQHKLAILLPVYAAFWADTLEVMKNFVDNMGSEAKTKELADSAGKVLESRLNWLNERVKKMVPDDSTFDLSALDAQVDITELFKK